MAKTKPIKKAVIIKPAEMTAEEIRTKIKETRMNMSKQLLERSVGKVKNTRGVYHMRKELARLLTVLKAKEE